MRSSLWHPVHRWGEVEHSTILKSGCQFSCDDMLWTKKIAKLKIHVGNRPYQKIPYFHPVMNSINKLLYVCVMLVLHWYVNQNIKNCDWICKNRSYCPWQEVQFFATNTKTHQYTFKFHCQNEEVMGGLLLLAASSQPIGDPYEQSGFIMELWWEGRGLSVTVKLRGTE